MTTDPVSNASHSGVSGVPASVPSRRRVLTLGLGAGAAALFTGTAAAQAAQARLAPGVFPGGLVRSRLTLPLGGMTGDVTSNSAVLWARSSGEGRLRAVIDAVDPEGYPLRGRSSFHRVMKAARTGQSTDFTSKLQATGLPSGTRLRVQYAFEDAAGQVSEQAVNYFSTAPGTWGQKGEERDRRGSTQNCTQRFVWTGDTAGQGWGINPDLGGMRAYAAMSATKPDFFIHCGDTIYADNPIQEKVTEKDGQVWRNLVSDGVEKVAESLEEFRGRHRYNLRDANVRDFYAKTPVIAQWDDHETHNNWYPGQTLTDDRYTERNVDVLASRAKRAWQEYQPIWGAGHRLPRVTENGYEPARIYRQVSCGPVMDVFCLDMRTFKGPNTDGKEPYATPILGEEQLQWLLRALATSRACWKVISADLPLGLVVPDGAAQESISNADAGAPLGRELELARLLAGIKRAGVKNVVFVTADVHYCAAHEYRPERAVFKDFVPFWEFVAGPISAGGFGPNVLDDTFGPKAEFVKAADFPNQSPRGGKSQFFGLAEANMESFTVQLIDGTGEVLYSKELSAQK